MQFTLMSKTAFTSAIHLVCFQGSENPLLKDRKIFVDLSSECSGLFTSTKLVGVLDKVIIYLV